MSERSAGVVSSLRSSQPSARSKAVYGMGTREIVPSLCGNPSYNHVKFYECKKQNPVFKRILADVLLLERITAKFAEKMLS